MAKRVSVKVRLFKADKREFFCAFLPEISHWLAVGKSTHARTTKPERKEIE